MNKFLMSNKTIIAMVVSVSTLAFASTAWAGDTDGDGLTDKIEKSIGYDINNADSDMDGLPDAFEAQRDGLLNTSSTNTSMAAIQSSYSVCASELDCDGDGIGDFLETHGFYFLENKFVSIGRQMTKQQWVNFKKKSYKFPKKAKKKTNPYKLTASVLVNKGYREFIPGNKFSVHLAEARPALVAAFTNKYGVNHKFLTGTSNVKGSLAQILKQLSNYPLVEPTTTNSQNELVSIPTFQTDPTKFSTDHDPMSDGVEVSKINLSPLIASPADHPLISGFPVIQGVLTSYDVNLDQEVTDSSGQSNASSWGGEFSQTHEVMHGWNASVSLETGLKFIFPEVKVTAEAGYEGSVTNSTTSSFSQESSNEFSFGQDVTYNTSCPATIEFGIDLVNSGTAPADNIIPRIDIYLGDDKPAYTYIPAMGKLHLGDLVPGDSKSYALPLVGDPDICVSLETLEYLESGGIVKVDVDILEAKISYFDNQTSQIVSNGDWTNYVPIIQHEAATVEFNIEDTQSYAHNGTFQAYAGTKPALTLRDILNIGLELPECSVNDYSGSCEDTDGNVQLDPVSFLGIYAFDELGKRLDDSQTQQKINTALNGKKNILDVTLNPRWKYQIVSPKQEQAQVLFTRIKPLSNGTEIILHASDSLGLKSVKFCRNTNRNACTDMVLNLEESTSSHSIFSTLLTTSYTPTGNERLRLVNSRGFETITPLFLVDAAAASLLNPYLERANRHKSHVNIYSGIEQTFPGAVENSLGLPPMNVLLTDIENHISLIKATQDFCLSVGTSVTCPNEVEETINYIEANHYNYMECSPYGLHIWFAYGSTSEMSCSNNPWSL